MRVKRPSGGMKERVREVDHRESLCSLLIVDRRHYKVEAHLTQGWKEQSSRALAFDSVMLRSGMPVHERSAGSAYSEAVDAPDSLHLHSTLPHTSLMTICPFL